jgi:hypothetical protein
MLVFRGTERQRLRLSCSDADERYRRPFPAIMAMIPRVNASYRSLSMHIVKIKPVIVEG